VAIFFIFILFLSNFRPFQSPRTSETPQTKTDKSRDPMVVSSCKKPNSDTRRIGWGKLGLQFDVPARDVEVLGGKPDEDYIRYVIKPKASRAYLELWFGPRAFSPEPDKELLLSSVEKNKRSVVNAAGQEISQNSSGKLSTGEVWRHTFLVTGGQDGAHYKAAQENADLFNHIIDSACYSERPKS
jgi:hypothetical protein